jgi:WXG100 family type VII secretion target
MEIRFEVPEFHASVAEVRRTATALVDGRTRAAGEVALLLDGWHGAAASEFAEAWEVWLRSSSSVASSLAGLAEALLQFQTDVMSRDASAASSLSWLTGRLS